MRKKLAKSHRNKPNKLLARTLYTYVRPINDYWVRREYKKYGYRSYSEFVDALIAKARTHKRMIPSKNKVA